MAQKQLLAYPMIDDIEYRERINSDKLNRMLKSIEESVLRSIIRGTEVQTQLNNLNLGVVSSYTAFSAQSAKFTQVLDSISGVAFASAFDPIYEEAASIPTGRSDTVAGILTVDWPDNRKMSKVPRVLGEVSPAVEIYVDDVLRNPDDDVYNILSQSNDDFWIESATGVHTLQINLPPSLNKKFNYLEIVPFPVFGVEISRIQYFDEQSRSQNIYTARSKGEDQVVENRFYNSSGPLIFHLQPRAFNNTIKIYYTVKDNVGAMGFSNIDIGLIDYYNTEQTTYLRFNTTEHFTSITPTEAKLDFYVNGTTDYNSYVTEVSIVEYVGGPNVINLKPTVEAQALAGTTLTVGKGEGMYLKVKMKEINMTTPVIRGCMVKYEEV